MSVSPSIISKRHEECLTCRVVSGAGLLGISFYLYSMIKKQSSRSNKAGVCITMTGVAALGVTRLLNVYPFKDKSLK